jgi:hypothetical protein
MGPGQSIEIIPVLSTPYPVFIRAASSVEFLFRGK